MWRILTSGTVALAVLSTIAVLPADAKTKRTKTSYGYRADERVAGAENPDSATCIRARSQDPAGNYRNYPCWARAALSGTTRR